jgi:tetratricopeptide (TPR) repeat protein
MVVVDENSPALDLSRLEPVVRQRIRQALEGLAGTLQDPSASDRQRADNYGEVGQLLHAYQLLGPARSYYERALDLAPQALIWSYYLAITLQRSGQLEEAAEYLEQALSLDGSEHPVRLRLADVQLELRNTEVAEELLQQALCEHPDCARALAGLGQIALDREEFSAAVKTLEQALTIAPEATRLHYPLGLAYRGLGDLSQARHHLERTGEGNPPSCDPLQGRLGSLRIGEKADILRGTELLATGKAEAAVPYLRRAVQINPESTEAWTNLGLALSRTGQRQEAWRAYLRALEIEPLNARARTDVARMLAGTGELEQAIEEARAAVAADDLYQPAHFVLGRLLLKAKSYDAAREQFAAARRLDPRHAGASIGEALTLLELGRHDEALVRLEEAHRLNPAAQLVTLVLARLLAASPDHDLRDGPRARQLAFSVTEPSQLVTQLETVALALAEEGRCGEAAEWQRRALDEATAQGFVRRVEWSQARLAALADGPPCRPDLPTTAALYPELMGVHDSAK